MPRVRALASARLFAALKGWVMASRDKDADSLIMYDRTLLWLTFGLAAIGFVMVTSASMPVGQRARRTIRFCLPNVMRSISSGILSGDGHATFAHDLLAKIQHDDADCVDHYAAYRVGRRELG